MSCQGVDSCYSYWSQPEMGMGMELGWEDEMESLQIMIIYIRGLNEYSRVVLNVVLRVVLMRPGGFV